MSRLGSLLAVTLALANAGCGAAPDFSTLPFAELGDTRVVDGGHSALHIVLTDAASAQRAEELARALAGRGATAAVVDLDAYLERVAASRAKCTDPTTLLDVYAQEVQRTLHFASFGAPALIGLGRGAAFVPLLLAQARSGIFGSGLSVGTSPALALPAPPCGHVAARVAWHGPESAFVVPPDLPLHAPWSAVAESEPAAILAELDALAARADPSQDVADLPLVELPQPGGGQAPWIAVVLSGDGGWANIDREIAEELASRGIAVLGWNSLRYFWEERSPDRAAADLARLVRYYTRAWEKRRVLLIGFSLGADVLPFMLSRAPPDVASRIAGMVLLNPSQTVDFQFHINNWLGGGDALPYRLEPEMRKISGIPVLCLHASEDEDGLCPLLAGRADTQVLRLTGDHHFDGDYVAVARLVLERFPVAP